MKYAVVFERAPGNYAAYVPDLPGCIATGETPEETKRNIREAITFHLDGLREELDTVQERIDREPIAIDEWNLLYRKRLQIERQATMR